jgi:hypothetical protein
MEGCLCVASLLGSLLFASSLLPRPVQLALLASQAVPSAPKPSIIDIIRQPPPCQKLAGNCTTTCQWIGCEQFCTTHCF